MSLPPAADQALAAFTSAKGWEARARLLLQWGNQLEPLNPEQRCEANRVHGCETEVWLVAEANHTCWQFKADSSARLLRGLLSVLLVRVNGLSAAELQQLDIQQWFSALGLERQLSPSRSNGLRAVLQKMQDFLAEV